MRLVLLLLALSALASPALADEPVAVLRGSSAPAQPWYEPPPEPQVVVQPVYVPLYYLPVSFYNPFLFRQPFTHSAKRNR